MPAPLRCTCKRYTHSVCQFVRCACIQLCE